MERGGTNRARFLGDRIRAQHVRNRDVGLHDPKVLDFFRTPHNDYLQALCDGGVLVGLPLAVMLGVVAVRVARASTNPAGSRSFEKWTRYGAAVGLTAVALQELVDFGLQTPANAVLLTVLAAYACELDVVPARGTFRVSTEIAHA